MTEHSRLPGRYKDDSSNSLLLTIEQATSVATAELPGLDQGLDYASRYVRVGCPGQRKRPYAVEYGRLHEK